MFRASPAETFLHPGEFYFGKAPGRVGTLLGSCVSITLWHQQRRLGGMCHILLPGRHRHRDSPLDGRFADEALELLANELDAYAVKPAACQVKLFGGGSMFAGTRAEGLNVGRRNIEAARRALTLHGLTVLTEHVGGTARRRLSLDLSTGHVWLAVPDEQVLNR